MAQNSDIIILNTLRKIVNNAEQKRGGRNGRNDGELWRNLWSNVPSLPHNRVYTQTTQTDHTLYFDRRSRPYSVLTRHATVPSNVFWLTSQGNLLHLGVKFYNFQRNTPILNMKHNAYDYCLFLKILHFLFKGSLNIPEYGCLQIGRVQCKYLYTVEHAVENI